MFYDMEVRLDDEVASYASERHSLLLCELMDNKVQPVFLFELKAFIDCWEFLRHYVRTRFQL